MFTSSLAIPFIYFAIIATALLANKGHENVLSTCVIAGCLLFLGLPDLEAYDEHYQLAASEGFLLALNSNNFEIGYVALVSICSQIIPFWMFYIGIIVFAIHAYLKFSNSNNSCAPYIFVCFLLSACIYFFSFTIRTTIASIFLAYSLLRISEGKNTAALILILAGIAFHMVIAPMLLLPILNKFKPFIARYYGLSIIIAVIVSAVLADAFLLSSLGEVGGFIETKINLYQDDALSKNGFFFTYWIILIASSVIFIKRISDFDRVLLVSVASVLILLYPYAFFQGRFMWLTSFIFAYLFTKIFLTGLRLGKFGRVLFTMCFSAFVLVRL